MLKKLEQRVNDLVDRLAAIPKDSPAHIPIARALNQALRELQKYKAR